MISNARWGPSARLPLGSYQLCFGPVANFTPPDYQTIDLTTVGTTTTVVGNHTSSPGAPAPPDSDGLQRVAASPALSSLISVDDTPSDTWLLLWLRQPASSHVMCAKDSVEAWTAPTRRTVVSSGATTTATGGTTTQVTGTYT